MKFRIVVACCGVSLAALTTAFDASAQSLPYNIGDAVRQAEQSRQAQPPRSEAAPALPQLVEPRLKMSEKEKLFVREFQIEGALAGDEAALRELLAPYEKRKLVIADIYAVADKVSGFYREKGYLLAKAYVPAQDARRGALRIKLLPGAFGAVTIKNQSLVRDDYLQGIVDSARAESPLIHKDPVERAMLMIADLPGAGTPRIVVSPGRAQGASDFVFDVPEGRLFEGYLFGDNAGSPYTGRNRLNGGVSLNSPLGFGDRLSASGIVSEDAGIANGRVAYSFPLGYEGLRAEISAFRTTYSLSGVYEDLEATGRAEAVSATLTYAAKRQREESVFIWGNFTHKWLNDNILGESNARRTLALGTIGATRESIGGLFGLPFATNATLSFTGGDVNFPDPTQKERNVAGADTVGSYYRINLSVNATLALDEQFSFSTWLRAQKSLSGNLDSSEQFSLAGFWGVRSFDEGLSGDSGYIVTPELRYALPAIEALRHSLGVFTDIGAAWLEDGSYTTTQKSYTGVNDVGLGYYATYEYSAGRSLLLKAQVAHTYGSYDSARTYDRHTKGLVQVGFTF